MPAGQGGETGARTGAGMFFWLSGRGQRRPSWRVGSGVAVLACVVLGGLAAPAGAGAVAKVEIGNGEQNKEGTYLNAQTIANTLAITAVNLSAIESISIVEPIDLTKSKSGEPHFNLSLTTPECNIFHEIKMAAVGGLRLICNTANFWAESLREER